MSDEYCVATPAKDLWLALDDFCGPPPGHWSGVDNNLFAGILGAGMVLWVLPGVIYGLVKLLSRACRRSAIAAEQSTALQPDDGKARRGGGVRRAAAIPASGTLMQFGWMPTVSRRSPSSSAWPLAGLDE